MEWNNLDVALEYIFGIMPCEEKDIILEAAKKDFKEYDAATGDSVAAILPMINEVFGKGYRVVPNKAISKYKQVLKVYTLEELRKAMENAKKDQYHTDSNYKWCTPEYFSRIDQVEKWFNADVGSADKKSSFVMPKMNIKR
jgi:hypothetical protein